MRLLRNAKSEGEENRAVSGRKKWSRGYREIHRAGAVMQSSTMAGLLAVFHLLTTGHEEGHIEDIAESVRLADSRLIEPGTVRHLLRA